MNTFRNSKGFTLIEMAVVLVIIGIILGAVIKGNDLIDNAKAKGVIQAPSRWEVPVWTFYDKKGYFPGDTVIPRDGQIDSHADLKTALTNEGIAYPADTISDVTFDIAGLTNPCAAGATVKRNAMLITNVPFDYAAKIDESIDGTADGTKGRVRYCGALGLTAVAAWPATGSISVTYFFDKQP
jgi:prepilin-type N-terminal cleavage/methylation domain-containing protein